MTIKPGWWSEATTEAPKTFTRPWNIAFPITLVTHPPGEIMELACVEGEGSGNKK